MDNYIPTCEHLFEEVCCVRKTSQRTGIGGALWSLPQRWESGMPIWSHNTFQTTRGSSPAPSASTAVMPPRRSSTWSSRQRSTHSYDQAPLQVTAKIHVPARAPVYTDLNPCTGTKNARRTIAGRQPYIRIRQPQNRDSQPPCEASGLWTAPRTARWTTAVRNWPPSGRAPLRQRYPKDTPAFSLTSRSVL